MLPWLTLALFAAIGVKLWLDGAGRGSGRVEPPESTSASEPEPESSDTAPTVALSPAPHAHARALLRTSACTRADVRRPRRPVPRFRALAQGSTRSTPPHKAADPKHPPRLALGPGYRPGRSQEAVEQHVRRDTGHDEQQQDHDEAPRASALLRLGRPQGSGAGGTDFFDTRSMATLCSRAMLGSRGGGGAAAGSSGAIPTPISVRSRSRHDHDHGRRVRRRRSTAFPLRARCARESRPGARSRR